MNNGKYTNTLGILSDDKKKIILQKFLDVTGLEYAYIHRIGDVSQPDLYKKEIPLSLGGKFIERVVDIVTVTDLASELFNFSPEEIAFWLMTPNSILFGDSPFEVCMRGDADHLKKWLKERMNKETKI